MSNLAESYEARAILAEEPPPRPPFRWGCSQSCGLMLLFWIVVFVLAYLGIIGDKKKPAAAQPLPSAQHIAPTPATYTPKCPRLLTGIYELNASTTLYLDTGKTYFTTLQPGAFVELTMPPVLDWYPCHVHNGSGTFQLAYAARSTLECQYPKYVSQPTPQEPYIAQEAPSAQPTVYLTDTGKRYHRPNCKSLQYSAYPYSVSTARNMGYTSCEACRP